MITNVKTASECVCLTSSRDALRCSWSSLSTLVMMLLSRSSKLMTLGDSCTLETTLSGFCGLPGEWRCSGTCARCAATAPFDLRVDAPISTSWRLRRYDGTNSVEQNF